MRLSKGDILRKAYKIYLDAYLPVTSRLSIGQNIYDSEWDALIILDACRVDALRAVAPEYSFFDQSDIAAVRSVGCTSTEWIANTFTNGYRDQIENTAYVSSNAWTERVLDYGTYPRRNHQSPFASWDTVTLDTFSRVDVGMWEDQDGDPYGASHPEETTDRAITVSREIDPERLIVHYIPPHAPFEINAIRENRERYDWEKYPYDALKNGHSRKEIWGAYIDNLRWSLDAIERLLSNLDAETVVITADHGEGFGEWGMYEHDVGLLSPQIRFVPWVETTAEDTETSRPNLTLPRNGARLGNAAKEKLKNLGYI